MFLECKKYLIRFEARGILTRVSESKIVKAIRKLLWFDAAQGMILTAFISLNLLIAAFSIPNGPYAVAADVAVSLEPARTLLAGEGFMSLNGELYSWGTPLYPAFLAVFLGILPWEWAIYSIVAVQCSLLYVIGLITGELAGNLHPRAGTPAQMIVLFNPNLVITAHLLQTELLFTFLLTAGITMVLLHRHDFSRRLVLAVGILLGLATLVRPVGQFVVLSLPLLFACCAIGRPRAFLLRSFIAGFAAIAVAAVVVSPWLLRNHLQFGTPFLTANAGMYLEAQYRQLLRNGLGMSAAETAAAAEREMNRHLSKSALVRSDFDALPKNEQSEILAAGFSRAIWEVPPGAHVRAIALSVSELFLAGGASNLRNYLGMPGKSAIVQFQEEATPSLLGAIWRLFGRIDIGYAALLVITLGFAALLRLAGLLGLVRMLDRSTRGATLALLVTIAVMSAAYLYLGQSRFRVPLEPYLAVMAAVGFSALREKIRVRSWGFRG